MFNPNGFMCNSTLIPKAQRRFWKSKKYYCKNWWMGQFLNDMSSLYDREAVPMKCQPYGHLNKTFLMPIPVDSLTHIEENSH